MSAARKLKLFQPVNMSNPVRQLKGWKPHHTRFLLALCAVAGGLTDLELMMKLGTSPSNTRGRRGELVDLGYLEDSGTTRKAPSGVAAIVWHVTRLGASRARLLKGSGR